MLLPVIIVTNCNMPVTHCCIILVHTFRLFQNLNKNLNYFSNIQNKFIIACDTLSITMS